MTTLDARGPHVLDTHELGRRPGTSLRVRRVLPAPEHLTVGLANVPAGANLDCDIVLESVMEGIYVGLRTEAPVVAECARCLDEVRTSIAVDAHELYSYPGEAVEDDALLVDGELLDLEPLLRDALALSLTGTMLCRDDCPGLCPDCGARLADDPAHTHGDAVDPRWAALSGLSADAPTTTPTPTDSPHAALHETTEEH